MRNYDSTKSNVKTIRALDESRQTLKAFSSLIAARATWDQLTLSAQQIAALRRIVTYVRRPRDASCCVLFVGSDGTVKTRAAQVLARELQLRLYRVDLSAIGSKYIGETEKNLRRLFAAAAASNKILFFDEADSLFGKRTDVSDSHDRFANLEISYLVQQLESHRGLVILASNRKSNIDQHFIRRLRFVVDFRVTGPG